MTSREAFPTDRFNSSEGCSSQAGPAARRDARAAGLAPDRPPVTVGGGETYPKRPRGFARMAPRS